MSAGRLLLLALVCVGASVTTTVSDWLVVCVSGITCGGKSTATRSIHLKFPGSVLLRQDDYYLADDDPRHEQLPELGWRNRELMTSIDMSRMRNDIQLVLNRKNATMPLLLLDGFQLYYDHHVTSLCHIKLFFLLSKDACKGRRRRRNRRIPDIDRYFEGYVWPAYLRYREAALGGNPDVVLVDGGADNTTIVEDICARIRQRIQTR